MITVTLVSLQTSKAAQWGIQYFSFGAHTFGWARYDGTFTPGTRPMEELCDEYVVLSPYADELVEFARERGWRVIRKESKVRV